MKIMLGGKDKHNLWDSTYTIMLINYLTEVKYIN
jgi:hypothetical protein